MEDVIFYCSQCHGRLLSTDTPAGGRLAQRLPGEEFYCPSCEMFVEPEARPEVANTTPRSANPADAPPNRGRSRASGSNAGGSQRGDLSDQGASQWRRDPDEGERNTWRDKD